MAMFDAAADEKDEKFLPGKIPEKEKPGFLQARLFYNDGLVSTGSVNPLHNIKNNFRFYIKKYKIFYSHFFYTCG